MRNILKNQIDLTYPRNVTYHICENYSFFIMLFGVVHIIIRTENIVAKYN